MAIRWLRSGGRWLWPGSGRWPTHPPPTAPPSGGSPQFHCPACRRPVDDAETVCAGCGEPLRPGR